MSYPKLHRIKSNIIEKLGGNPTATEIEAEYNKMKAKHDTDNQAAELRDDYVGDVINEMLGVFKTTSQTNSIADYLSYMVMSENPSIFSDEGLEDDEGNPLDTDEKVSDYASIKLSEIEAYAVFRMKRKQQYKKDMDQLQGE